jgi:hypothetical protein
LFACYTISVQAQPPSLSSHPSASAVLFLDTDGHTLTGTIWNMNPGSIICGGSGLNDVQITEVFNRVAEDYRPFNINVTTDSTVFLAAPVNRRMRVIITVSSSWYGNAGGVAYINSFTWGDDTPCFTFSALLGYNVKKVAENASHEAGHTFGLFHQSSYDNNCVKINDYHGGVGTGEIGWAPIMGRSYSHNLSLWNLGPNSFGCTSIQNDLDTITTKNGFSYRTDDYTNTFGGAANNPFVSNSFSVNGIIERNTDLDMLQFTIPVPGRFQLNAIPYNVGTGNAGSNLDLQVTLFDNTQTELNVYNPGALLSSVIDSFLLPGVYYLRVEGKGNMYAPNYASLGSYALQGNFDDTPLPLRRLELKGQPYGDRHKLTWIIDADEAITAQVLEASADGRSFTPVSQPVSNERSIVYKPVSSGTVQYRLHVTFDNGKQYYSNIVTLHNAANKPRLLNTLSQSQLQVNSPANYTYVIYDQNGKMQSKGQLTNGTNIISTVAIPAGMYIIRFTNGGEQWTDKFIRQ